LLKAFVVNLTSAFFILKNTNLVTSRNNEIFDQQQ